MEVFEMENKKKYRNHTNRIIFVKSKFCSSENNNKLLQDILI